MQAHGGGIVEVDNVFYLIGENKLDGSAFQSINCYSSTVSLPLPSTSTFAHIADQDSRSPFPGSRAMDLRK